MKNRIPPKKGQESVWDYPRPPKLEKMTTHLEVRHKGGIVARTNRGIRILETSHPPVYYFPPEDINMKLVIPSPSRSTYCEFKGAAVYWSLNVAGEVVKNVGWSYPDPNSRYTLLKDFIAFYASKVEECYVGEERVQSQEGDFYGGWITSNIVGPFKGGPGTWGW